MCTPGGFSSSIRLGKSPNDPGKFNPGEIVQIEKSRNDNSALMCF